MRTIGVVVLGLAAGCGGMEPSNTDLGLHVEATVFPRAVSLADTAATIRIRAVVTNPSDRGIVIVSGGPPTASPPPTESRGLTQSFRIAYEDGSPNVGPSLDAWGEPVDTVRARGVSTWSTS